MNQARQTQAQQTYVPAFAIAHVTFKHSLQKLPIATLNAPEHICGAAQCVGYTGNQEHDLAIYRLKVRTGDNKFPVITLPGFFVIDDGIFMDYEQWCCNEEAK